MKIIPRPAPSAPNVASSHETCEGSNMHENDGPVSRGALSRAGRVDAACDRFEAAWRGGERPRIEDFLAEFSVDERPELLYELISLDAECRRRRGEMPQQVDY